MALPGSITYTENIGSWTGDPNIPNLAASTAALAAESVVTVTPTSDSNFTFNGSFFALRTGVTVNLPVDVYNSIHGNGIV